MIRIPLILILFIVLPAGIYAQTDSTDYYRKGREDAKVYYTKDSPFWWTAASVITIYGTVIFTPLETFIPPRKKNLNNPDNPNNGLLETNEQYFKGYRKEAHRKKKVKTLSGFIISAVTLSIILSMPPKE